MAPRASKRPTASSKQHSSKYTNHRSFKKPSYFSPSHAEVVEAVRSLYADRLEPFGRILLRRVRERYAAKQQIACVDEAPMVDPKNLQSLCSECESLRVEAVDGNEISVSLVGEPTNFVDVCDPTDPYPMALWMAFSAHLAGLHGAGAALPGGRYACAQALAALDLPCLAGLSLGEVCHIVQLAVSQRKLLGYSDGHMVPYRLSEEAVKEHCAVWQRPFCNPAKQPEPEACPVATWEETRICLAALLRAERNADGSTLTLSNIKRLFRSKFGLDLHETALGHSRLVDLLTDPRLQDVCALHCRGAGQVVVIPPTSPSKGRSGAHAALGGEAGSRFLGGDEPRAPPCLGTSPVPPTISVPSPLVAAATSGGTPTGCYQHFGQLPSPPPGLEHVEGKSQGSSPPKSGEKCSLKAQLERLLELDEQEQKATLKALAAQVALADDCAAESMHRRISSTESTIAESEQLAVSESDISNKSAWETSPWYHGSPVGPVSTLYPQSSFGRFPGLQLPAQDLAFWGSRPSGAAAWSRPPHAVGFDYYQFQRQQ